MHSKMQRKTSRTQNKTKTEDKKWSSFFNLDMESDPNQSFYEKWREAMDRNRESARNSKYPARVAQVCMRLLMCFQAPTQMYMFHFHIIPFFFEPYGPWSVYYLRVIAWFCLINGLANYLCVILYDPSYKKTKDNPYLSVEKAWDNPPDQFAGLIQNNTSQNGHCVYDITAKEGLPWEFCSKCEGHVPPRAYHCSFCKKCVLKRDHHCFMVGNCIGFNNQRYFVVLAFYAMLVGCIGGYFSIKYVEATYWPYCGGWWDVLFPVAIGKSVLFGTVSAFDALLTFHCFLETAFGLIGFAYFTSQMGMSAEGKTLYELAKQLPIKNHNSYNKNLRSVFGDFWALNFLFPMVLIFRQRDDGIHWDGVKIDHNMKKDEEVHVY